MGIFFSVLNIGFVVFYVSVLKKKLYDPLVVFSLFWALIMFLASLQLFNLYTISKDVWLMFELGFISFSAGYGIAEARERLFKVKAIDNIGKGTYEINYSIVTVFIIIATLFWAYRLKDYFSLVRQGYSGEELRYMFFEYEPTDTLGKYVSYIQSFIATPTVYAVTILAVIDIIDGKRNKLFILSSMAMIVVYVVVSGGRVIILNTAFHIIFLLLIKSRLHLIKFFIKYKKIIISIGIVGISVFVILNTRRGIESGLSDLLEESYVYYTGCMQHFERRIDKLRDNRDNGIAFIVGYLKPVFLVISKLGVSLPDSYYIFQQWNGSLQSGMRIGPRTWYNAFVSMNYHFYLSFGAFGIFLGNMCYGILSDWIYKKVKKYQNIFTISILLLLLQGILTSMVRWQFISPAYALAFIYLRVFMKKTSNINLSFLRFFKR